jgi:dTDP-L-rhamnose 4-epimerase
MKVLVTGGAGFIGTNLVRRLLAEKLQVSILDNFSPQIHGSADSLPEDMSDSVELFRGDVRDSSLLSRAIDGVHVVVHLAAETGTGQSMYELVRYEEVNIGGTAKLLECLLEHGTLVEKLIVASSRSIYGEGAYLCAEHGTVFPDVRSRELMRTGKYEPLCPLCSRECIPQPTSENARINPLSFYAITKNTQEQMVLTFARSRQLSAYALRYQNVYGPGQSLRNPYTGILAVFSTLARSNLPIRIFEDGHESRDFVFIEDVVEATWRCIQNSNHEIEALNVGTGDPCSVLQVAKEIVKFFSSDSLLQITGEFREGDIRHNYADSSKLVRTLGFSPAITFNDGLGAFLCWAAGQINPAVGYEASLHEMRERGILHG